MSPEACLSTILGPFLVLIGIWQLIYTDNLAAVWRAVKNSPAILHYTSTASLLMGFVILSQYDSWHWNIWIWLTLLGWILSLRGALGLFLPHVLIKLYLGNPRFTKIMGIFPLLWGCILLWAGFFM